MDLAQVIAAFKAHGARRIYYKWLAANDNSKNQIYLAGDFSALNVLPVGRVVATPTGQGGGAVFKAGLRLKWLTAAGNLSEAPGAKLILYPQYPEVRLSGFLRGSPDAPNAILASRQAGRALLLAVTGSNEVLGFAIGAESEIARVLPPPEPDRKGVLRPLPGEFALGEERDREELLAELRRIVHLGWIDSKRLGSNGEVLPCNSLNCGGLTLEAELGIRPNSKAEPDFKGWEIKQLGVTSLDSPNGTPTLMTPEPDGGQYKELGVLAFVQRYGYPDQQGREDRRNFGGVHRVGSRARTGLTLTLAGYDASTGKITDPQKGIQLLNDAGEVAAAWSYAKLIHHWKRKHDRAAYVLSEIKKEPHRRYRYGPSIRLGSGTDILLLLKALSSGAVYYDPGIKVLGASTSSPTHKRRSQFRTRLTQLPSIYRSMEIVNVE